jgi:hypothetical protein
LGVFVEYSKIKGDSKVFLTPEEPLSIGVSVREGEGFEIKLREASAVDLSVSYWVLD